PSRGSRTAWLTCWPRKCGLSRVQSRCCPSAERTKRPLRVATRTTTRATSRSRPCARSGLLVQDRLQATEEPALLLRLGLGLLVDHVLGLDLLVRLHGARRPGIHDRLLPDLFPAVGTADEVLGELLDALLVHLHREQLEHVDGEAADVLGD